MHTYRAHHDVSVLGDYLEVPGLGFLAVNAFVIHAAQPVVADTGMGLPDRDFVTALAAVIDPADVRWIWLTHPDRLGGEAVDDGKDDIGGWVVIVRCAAPGGTRGPGCHGRDHREVVGGGAVIAAARGVSRFPGSRADSAWRREIQLAPRFLAAAPRNSQS